MSKPLEVGDRYVVSLGMCHLGVGSVAIASLLINQEFETCPREALLADDVCVCVRCASGLRDEEWEEANNTEIIY
ncbi:MAG: hypothetical protein KME23_20720 [Goleter apudmare HA4340-LM2]|nr:hypothetical protein [Goleter apudmare HA4340-LM2]